MAYPDTALEAMVASMIPAQDAIDQRLAYLDIRQQDLDILREIGPLLAPHMDAVVDAFYAPIHRMPQLRDMVSDSAVARRLHSAHLAYFSALTAGVVDAQYVRDRVRIGLVHQQVGLEPLWYIGAYRNYLSLIAPLLQRLLDGQPERFLPALLALGKMSSFDMTLALDTYIESGRRQLLDMKAYSERIISSLPCGVIVADADGAIRTVNQAMQDISGCSEPELLRRSHADLIPPAAVRAGAAAQPSIEFQLCRRDGATVWVKASIASLRINGHAGTVTTVEDIALRKRAEEELVRMANYDTLTGLANRSLLLIRLEHAVAGARRQQRSAALLFLDLDRFKTINDSLGHDAGDRVLVETGCRLQNAVRETDLVARLGGDEFVVLLADLHNEVAAAAMSRHILEALGRPMLILGHEVSLSCSIGISIYPQDGADAKLLLKNADAAMYQAKALGRCNYQFYAPELNARTLDRLTLENALRHAIERDELVLLYQPQYSLASGEMTGVEALLRWRRPEHELVPPDVFIPIAEESGLIVPIGEWVLRTACAQQVAWRRAGLPPVRMAVNLSARQFRQPGLEAMVAQVLADTGCDASCMELEITESILMDRPERAAETLQRLSDMGLRLAIDDFGTGYSSLAYLKRFPIHTLKIDRSFVRDIPASNDDAAIAGAVVALAHSMQLSVVAEGVETPDQRAFLATLGCDSAQGYLYSRPDLPQALAALLRLAPD